MVSGTYGPICPTGPDPYGKEMPVKVRCVTCDQVYPFVDERVAMEWINTSPERRDGCVVLFDVVGGIDFTKVGASSG